MAYTAIFTLKADHPNNNLGVAIVKTYNFYNISDFMKAWNTLEEFGATLDVPADNTEYHTVEDIIDEFKGLASGGLKKLPQPNDDGSSD